MPQHLLDALKELADKMAKLKAEIARRGAWEWDSQTRLDNYLLKEEGGTDYAQLAESYYEPLLLVPPGKRSYAVVSIDGGSRSVDTSFAYVAIASVSVASRSSAATYPSLSGGDGLDLGKYMGLALDVDPPPSWSPPGGVALESPAGVRYSSHYNRKQVVDEVRTGLENRALARLVEEAESSPKLAEKLLVVLDGPIYHTPRIFKHQGGGVEDYKRAWAKLVEERVEALRRAERIGLPIISFVKRIDRSRMLVKSPEYLAIAAKHGVPSHAFGNDYALLTAIIEVYARRGFRGPAYFTPVLRAPASRLGVKDHVPSAPDKLFFYIALRATRGLMAFRVELTPGAYDILRRERVREVVASETYITPLPIPLLIADSASKSTAHSVALLLASMLHGRGVPLTYDTVMDLGAGL